MTLPIPFSRPFGAWATALTDRYRSDPFFRVHIQVALLQLALTAVIVVMLSITYQYLAATSSQILSITDPVVLKQTALHRREVLFMSLFGGFFLLTSVFSIIVANVSLRPSRNTLEFQKRFIGNIAHEIRTPLAIIKTSTEVALFDPNLTKEARDTMEETLTELNRISDTINNLLSFDSLIRPRTMQFQAVDLSAIAETVCERHQDLALSRGVALTFAPMTGALVNGNATALEQVVTNIVKNALNYTPEDGNGRVTVEIGRTDQGSIALTVSDTGIGINEKDLYHVFEPFYRADKSRTRGVNTGTSGLGLAIVNEIVRLHHGAIMLRSAPKHGTTIRIVFPKAKETKQDLPLMAASGSPHEATLDFS